MNGYEIRAIHLMNVSKGPRKFASGGFLLTPWNQDALPSPSTRNSSRLTQPWHT